MTYDDIITHLSFDSGDDSSKYQIAALRWINATRSYIANNGPWESTKRSNIFFQTSAATTTGIYILQDQSSNKYEALASDSMFDATNEITLRHEALASTWELDQDRSTTGQPTFWADAGLDANGERQVMLWPVPDGTFDIYFIGRRRLTDITDSSVSADPYFGPVSSWFAVLLGGTRYYHDLSNNVNPFQIQIQRMAFQNAIRVRKKTESITVTSSLQLEPVNSRGGFARLGRLDPSVYDNR